MKKTIFAAAVACAFAFAAVPAKAQSISAQDVFNGQLNSVLSQTAVAASVALSSAGKATSEASALNAGNVNSTDVDSKAISNAFAGSFQSVGNVQTNFVGLQTAVAGSLAASAGNASSIGEALNAGNVNSAIISSIAKK